MPRREAATASQSTEREGETTMTNCRNKNRLREFVPGTWSDFDALLNQVLNTGAARSVRGVYAPASVWEDEGSYHIELDLPGVGREAIELTLEKGDLQIVAERKRSEEDRQGWRDERGYGKVTRRFTLPEAIDAETIKAELTDGVLHVSVAKSPAAQPKRIDVN